EDDRLAHTRQPVVGLLNEVAEQSTIQVDDVGRFLTKNLASHGPEAIRQITKRLSHGICSGDVVILNPLAHGLYQRFVVQQAEVKLENLGGFGTKLFSRSL